MMRWVEKEKIKYFIKYYKSCIKKDYVLRVCMRLNKNRIWIKFMALAISQLDYVTPVRAQFSSSLLSL